MALRSAGCPIREIAERIGQSRASTYRWLVRYGIPRRAVTLRRGAQRTHGDRGPWPTTPDLLALWNANSTSNISRSTADPAHPQSANGSSPRAPFLRNDPGGLLDRRPCRRPKNPPADVRWLPAAPF